MIDFRKKLNGELQSIIDDETWNLVDIPKGTKTIGCKWIFRKKLRSDGIVDKLKVRLVVRALNVREGYTCFITIHMLLDTIRFGAYTDDKCS